MQEYYNTHSPLSDNLLFVSVLTRDANYQRYFTHINNHVNIITSGSLSIKTGSERIEVRSGNAVILPVGLPHHIETAEGCTQIGIELNYKMQTGNILSLLLPYFNAGINVIPMSVTKQNYVEMKHLILNFSEIERLAVINKAEGYLLEMMLSHKNKDNIFKGQFLSLLDEGNPCLLTLTDVMSKLHYSKTHVERLMHESFGTSVTEYLRGFRLETAKQLLCDTNMTVAQIAEYTGFSDSAHFIKSFSRRYGMTPKRYKKTAIVTFD